MPILKFQVGDWTLTIPVYIHVADCETAAQSIENMRRR